MSDGHLSAPDGSAVLLDEPGQGTWRSRAQHLAGRLRYGRAVLGRPALRGVPFLLGARSSVRLGAGGRLVRGPGLVLDSDVRVVAAAPVRLGRDVYVGRGCQLVAYAGLTVGDRCRFGERVSVHDEDHAPGGHGYLVTPVAIGDDVWLGAGAVVLRGSTIGDGAVVAAGAVVRGHVPARSVVGGVPARVLRGPG
jgi:acetyltransferase-like isoleucine patch superfamily enzyme